MPNNNNQQLVLKTTKNKLTLFDQFLSSVPSDVIVDTAAKSLFDKKFKVRNSILGEEPFVDQEEIYAEK